MKNGQQRLWARLSPYGKWHRILHEIAGTYHFVCGSFLDKEHMQAELCRGKGKAKSDFCPRCSKINKRLQE